MDLLISFVNQLFTPGLTLGLLDTTNGDFRWVLDETSEARKGATGIAATTSTLYVCAQQNAILVLDETGVVQRYDLQDIADPHSLLLAEGHLYCVSTGTNEIYELTLDDDGRIIGETVYWQAPAADCGYDAIHLNSIAEIAGSLYVTGFGHRRRKQDWSDIEHGFVKNISSPTQYPGIRQPHSVVNVNNSVLYCESKSGNVRVLQSDIEYEIGGYTRGIATAGETLFVGSSDRRRLSKSTGKRTGDFEDSQGKCRVTAIDLASREVTQTYDLSAYANEIYEIYANPPPFVRSLSSADPLIRRIEAFEENATKLLELAEDLVSRGTVESDKKIVGLASQLAKQKKISTARADSIGHLESAKNEQSVQLNQLKLEIKHQTSELSRLETDITEMLDQISRLEERTAELDSELGDISSQHSELLTEAAHFVEASLARKYRHYKLLKSLINGHR